MAEEKKKVQKVVRLVFEEVRIRDHEVQEYPEEYTLLVIKTSRQDPQKEMGKASLVFKPKNTYTETLLDGRQAEIREYHFWGIYR